ncbi:hypothetical protein CIRG_07785 [Coccidioides immitis RMSCC 2394]|uniref:Uncharacterized protein n=1 Tax=Coccidioides immitis RMSCC 2394 TaxID=404692 RepID=A0A0J6YLU3_COCIT|nr:hypothetical protein CIRG_07785 [Coccidioides immitis RMSCC 2394]
MAPFARPSVFRYMPVNILDDDVPPSPCASDSNVGSKGDLKEDDYASESDVLLTSPPPEYQDIAQGTKDVIVDTKVSNEVHSERDIPADSLRKDAEAGYPKTQRRRCCGRRKEKDARRCQFTKWSLCVGIAKSILLASLVCMVFKSLFYTNDGHHEHHDHEDGYHDGSGDGPTPRREIKIRRRSTGIAGTYPLYDLLSLRTRSGSIAVVIDPQPADPNDPDKPARVDISSRSGSVLVQFRMPEHGGWYNYAEFDDDMKDLRAELGSIRDEGRARWTKSRPMRSHSTRKSKWNAHSTKKLTTLPPRPGNINARLTPLVFHDADYLEKYKNVSITTANRQGETNLVLNEALIFQRPESNHSHPPRMRGLRHSYELTATATHTTRGLGSVSVTYPPSWAGHVHAIASRTGNILVGGEGVQIIQRGKTFVDGVKEAERTLPIEKEWWGSRGDMNVKLGGRTSMVQFWVRDD